VQSIELNQDWAYLTQVACKLTRLDLA